jgi:hypothetical protein
MPEQSLDASLDLSSPHRFVSIAKHPHNGSLDDTVAETPLRWLRPWLHHPGLDAAPGQVQNGLKPWGRV